MEECRGRRGIHTHRRTDMEEGIGRLEAVEGDGKRMGCYGRLMTGVQGPRATVKEGKVALAHRYYTS